MRPYRAPQQIAGETSGLESVMAGAAQRDRQTGVASAGTLRTLKACRKQ
jgi:hypothetical protein